MNDTVIFLILAGIGLVFRWLSGPDSKKKPPTGPRTVGSPNDPPARTPVTRAPAESEEEKVRRFMEALGMPAGSRPPPPVRSRPVAPRQLSTPARSTRTRREAKRQWGQPLPPLVTVPAPLEQPLLPPIAELTENAPPPAVRAELTPGRGPLSNPVVRQAPPAGSATRPGNSLGEMLRRPGSARRAILLREILGAPRGLQAFDAAGF